MLPNLYELMYGAHSGKNSVVSHHDMAGDLRVIAHHTIVADHTIVRNMAVGHNQTIIANNGFPAISGTTVDRHKLPDRSVIAYLYNGVFSFKLQILRGGGNN